MTDLELTQLTRRLAKQFFNQAYPYEARFNRRLRTMGGRYFLADHHIEINPLMLSEFDEETLVGVIKHELVHYWLHVHHEKPDHRNPHFKELLQRTGGLRYAPVTSKRRTTTTGRLVYQCKKCGQLYHRQRRINVRRYVCGRCGGRLGLKH